MAGLRRGCNFTPIAPPEKREGLQPRRIPRPPYRGTTAATSGRSRQSSNHKQPRTDHGHGRYLEDLLVHQLRTSSAPSGKISRGPPPDGERRRRSEQSSREAAETHVEENRPADRAAPEACDPWGSSASPSHCRCAEGLMHRAEEFLDGDRDMPDVRERAHHRRRSGWSTTRWRPMASHRFARSGQGRCVSLLEGDAGGEKGGDRKLTKSRP